MKKFSLLVVLFISIFVVSCKKSNDAVVTPKDNGDGHPQDVAHYDASNTTPVSWDELPEAVRNATPLEAAADKNARNETTLFSRYNSSVGPWGGNGGSPFSITPPAGSRIYAMALQTGGYVDRLIVWYITSSGQIYQGVDRGGNGGKYYYFPFASDEYIYAISGRSGGYVDRIKVFTNKKWFDYGGNGGSPFSVSVPAGYQILGFYGRSGGYLDQIGFHVYTF